jgi:hypothetical protein
MSEEEETRRLKSIIYDNKKKLAELYEKYDLLRHELLAIEQRLKEKVPPPAADLEDIKKRIEALENIMILYVDGIQKVIATPSAVEQMARAEQELQKVKSWVDPSMNIKLGERPRKKRSFPQSWQTATPEEEELIAQDRAEWEQVLRNQRIPTVDKDREKGIYTNTEDWLKKLEALSDSVKEHKRREEETRKKAEEEAKKKAGEEAKA